MPAARTISARCARLNRAPIFVLGQQMIDYYRVHRFCCVSGPVNGWRT